MLRQILGLPLRRFQALASALVLILMMGILSACAGARQPEASASTELGSEIQAQTQTGKLKVVATTTIVGDVVHQIAGDLIELTVLMQPGVDPHSFAFTPQQVVKVGEADLVFMNGVELEAFMDDLLENAATKAELVSVSQDVKLLRVAEEHEDEADHKHEDEADHEHEAEAHHEDDGHAHKHGEFDPHVWWNVANVQVWSDTIANVLAKADPAHAEQYNEQAARYKAELSELNSWIKERVAQLPESERKLVTDHDAFGYLANTYGFELVGTVLPNINTLSEPSAQELAQLHDTIQAQQIKAIFVGSTVNPSLAQRIADDTGIKVIVTYTDSLGKADSDAATYIDFMRSTINTIVEGLQ